MGSGESEPDRSILMLATMQTRKGGSPVMRGLEASFVCLHRRPTFSPLQLFRLEASPGEHPAVNIRRGEESPQLRPQCVLV